MGLPGAALRIHQQRRHQQAAIAAICRHAGDALARRGREVVARLNGKPDARGLPARGAPPEMLAACANRRRS